MGRRQKSICNHNALHNVCEVSLKMFFSLFSGVRECKKETQLEGAMTGKSQTFRLVNKTVISFVIKSITQMAASRLAQRVTMTVINSLFASVFSVDELKWLSGEVQLAQKKGKLRHIEIRSELN